MAFYYYGAKHRLAKYYPAPQRERIVEPFAGAAGYSCYWAERRPGVHQFLLVEKDPRVVDLWERLLDGMPTPKPPSAGEYTEDFIFMTSAASNAMAKSRRFKMTPRAAKVYGGMQRRIDRVIPFMRGRTEVVLGDYQDVPNGNWTWFLDPPYQLPADMSGVLTRHPKGLGYAKGCDSHSINYRELGDWALSRFGQVIVTEQKGADWLPFSPLIETQDSQGKMYDEVVFHQPA